MTRKELVKRTINFENNGTLPFSFDEEYGYDILQFGPSPSPDDRCSNGTDEWGCVWKNIGKSSFGEVRVFPLDDWDKFDNMNIPDPLDPKRWENVPALLNEHKDKFLLCSILSIYERGHFLRGLENIWMDIYDEPEKLCRLVDVFTDISVKMTEKAAELGADGIIMFDDWGLQNSLMISPEKWREIWKPRYKRIYDTAHSNGLHTFLHSCGYISDIIEDLIEIGLDVLQIDQQENMGLENLHKYAGRITFFSPVDIQAVMPLNDFDMIRDYCGKMVNLLGTPNGGFIPKWYPDPNGAGHTHAACKVMFDEFLRLGNREKGKPWIKA